MVRKNNDNYISLQEASELCDYSQEYLSLRARHGKLKAVKFGRNWVTTKEWVNEYVAQIKNGRLGNAGNADIRPTTQVGYQKKRGGKREKGVIRKEREYKGNRGNFLERLEECFVAVARNPVVGKSFVLVLIFILVSGGIILAKPSMDLVSATMSDVVDDTIKMVEEFSDDIYKSTEIAKDNFIEFNFAIINTIDEYNNSISDAVFDTSEFISQSFVSTKKGIMATEENFNSSIKNVKINFKSGYDGMVFMANEIPKRISNDISQKIENTENKIKNATADVSLFLADATESVEYSFEIFGKYGNWLADKANDISELANNTYDSVSATSTNIYNSVSKSVSDTRKFIFNPWTKDKTGQEIVLSDIESIEEFEELKQEIISLQEKIITMEKDGLPQKEIIKEIQRITKIEPLKEITKEIRIIDDKSLSDFKIQLATINTQLANINKWEADISDLQKLTAKIQSSPPRASAVNAPIYIGSQGIQSGGSASFASLGVSGSAGIADLGVGGSATFGADSGDLFTVRGTSTFNALMTATQGLVVGDSALTIDQNGNITTIGNLITSGNITTTESGDLTIAGDLTVAGAQTYSGKAAFTSAEGPQMSIRYDDTNKLDISVSSAGVATFDASSGEIHAATGDAFYTEGGNPIRESGEEILRGSVSVFLYGMPVQTSSTSFKKISKHFSNTSDISFPTAYTGTTRVHRLVINYADDIATDANSNFRVVSADSSTIYSAFNLSGLANTILEEPTPYITEIITIPDTDWQLELKVPTDKSIRISQIYLTAYDKVD